MARKRTKRESVTEPKPERRSYRMGDTLLHLPAPARIGDQALAAPGTRWAAAAGGCELTLVDEVAYCRFTAGAPPPGRHHHHHRDP